MIRNLGYVGFRSPAAYAWRTFGPDVLGLQLAPDGPDGAVRLRADDAAWRIAVHPGERDDLAYLGWNVGDVTRLDALTKRAQAAGLDPVVDDGALAAARAVTALVSFIDPFGFRHELTHGLANGGPFLPGRPLSAGFVTGAQGLGHVVLVVPDLTEAEAFVTGVLGLRLSDTIDGRTTLRFFHCPGRAARHHTLALAAMPGMVGVHHLMLEVASLDDIGHALDVIDERGVPLAATLGKHPNDLMTSIYVLTPSGFQIEYGTGGVLVDDDSWDATVHYDHTHVWGHKRPPSSVVPAGIVRPFAAAGS